MSAQAVRRALVMVDQGLSSLSNVVVAVFVARSLPSEGFGAFGVAVVAFMLVQGPIRALIGESLLSGHSSADERTRDRLVPDLLGAAVLVSAVGSVVVAVSGVVAGGQAGSAMLALAVVLPLIAVQDAWRFVFVIDRPAGAVVVDAVWLAAVCVTLPLAPDRAGAAWFVLAWGLSAGLGAMAGVILGRRSLAMPHPVRWLRLNRAMGTRFLGEWVTGQSVGQVVLMGLGGIAGLTAVAAVRAAQVFYGPLNTVHQGIYLALVPEGARARDEDHLRRLMISATLVLVAVATVWMWVGFALPDRWGDALFGDTWAKAGELMVPMGLAMVAGSAATGGFAGVRALGDAKESFRARLRTVVPQLALPLVGAMLGAGLGYVIGFGFGYAVSAAIWWTAFANARRSAATSADRGAVGAAGSRATTVGSVVS